LHPSAVHYREHRDGRSLYVLLRDVVRNGISHDDLARILGPFKIVSAQDDGTDTSAAQSGIAAASSNLDRGEQVIEYPMSFWHLRLTLRDGRLVDHDPGHFEIYPDALAIGDDGLQPIGRTPDEKSQVGLRGSQVKCKTHGIQGFGLACTHVAHAIDSGEPVGFHWGDDDDMARPDAWCHECELRLRAVPPGETSEQWFLDCDYKILCSLCWDLAKERLFNKS
jgi:hypothetical protein